MMRRYLLLPALIALAGIVKVQAQCIAVLQPGPTDGIDAACFNYPLCEWANGNPRPCDTTNRSGSPDISASSKAVFGLDQTIRSYLKFNMARFGKIQPGALPTKATLNLYYFRDAASGDEHIFSNGNAFYITRVVKPWIEDTIRWEYPLNSGISAKPRVSSGTSAQDRVLVPSTTAIDEDVSVDITAMVQFWLSHPDSNFGFEIRLVDETPQSQVHFCSSNYKDDAFRPKLTIDFPKVIANAGNDTLTCGGSPFQLRASGGDKYTWKALAGTNDILNRYDVYNPVFTPTKAQSYSVEAVTGNCSDQDTINLLFAQPSPAVINTTDSTSICAGDSLQLEATGGNIYFWTPKDGLSDRLAPRPWAKPAKTTKYFVQVLQNAGDQCPGKDSILIFVNKNINGRINVNDTTICEGDSIQLIASGGRIYNWSPSTGLSETDVFNPYAKPTDTTKYIVEIAENNACSDFDTVVVNVTTSAFADAGIDQEICIGDTVQLDGTGSGTFVWTPNNTLNDGFTEDPLAFPIRTTTYALKVSDQTACFGIDSVTITVRSKPEIQLNITDTTVCEGEDVLLSASGATNYEWSTGETGDQIEYKVDENTEIRVAGNDGQCSSDTLLITLLRKRCGNDLVLAPKYFSPNSDGIMDRWVIQDLDRYPDNEVIVFNKWGDIILRKEGYSGNWDGTYNGQEVAEDTYMYLIRINDNGTEYTYKGTLTIVR